MTYTDAIADILVPELLFTVNSGEELIRRTIGHKNRTSDCEDENKECLVLEMSLYIGMRFLLSVLCILGTSSHSVSWE